MASDPRELIRLIYEEAHNQGKMDILDQAIAPDYVRHQPPMADVNGVPGLKKFLAETRSAYSDLEFKIHAVLMDGETTVVRYTLTGRHTGTAPTIQAQPTGNMVKMPGCVVSQWVGGKIAVDWVYNDYLGLLQQFGVYPPPGMFA